MSWTARVAMVANVPMPTPARTTVKSWPTWLERPDLAEADGRQRDERHVEPSIGDHPSSTT